MTLREVERADAAPEKRPPGQADHQCRTAIRDLIEEYGEHKAMWMVSVFFEDECLRMKR